MTDIRRVDFVTSVFTIMSSLVCFTISLMSFIFAYDTMKAASEMVENMPDGEGVADGYIVLGKLLGGGLTTVGGMILYAVFVGMGFFFVVYTVLSIIYYLNRRKYNQLGILDGLKTNASIKIVVNAIQIIGLGWFLIGNEIYDLLSIMIVVVLLLIEFWLIKSLGEYNNESKNF